MKYKIPVELHQFHGNLMVRVFITDRMIPSLLKD